ncbi:rCG23610 [Rattus norvegicus]|uniref:RCG23610 n=1 Tax=Rattus norvegicus TaxID=10116 RepID=A6KPQ0_RAT|nr:rCG23610 [Rattus norvegicus]
MTGYLKDGTWVRGNKATISLSCFTPCSPTHSSICGFLIHSSNNTNYYAGRPFLFTFSARRGHLCFTLSNTHIFNNIDYTAVVQSLQMKYTTPGSALGILYSGGWWDVGQESPSLLSFLLVLASCSNT